MSVILKTGWSGPITKSASWLPMYDMYFSYTWVIWREFGVVSMDTVCGTPWRICELKTRHAYVIMMKSQKHFENQSVSSSRSGKTY